MNTRTDLSALPRASSTWRRLLPLAVIVGLVILFFALGLKDHLGIDALARRYAEIEGWRASHPIGSAALAILLYAGVTAIALPAGALLTVAIGVVFGWALGASIVVIGATIGAIILFLAARTALEPFFRARAGKFLTRFADGFRSDAASYLLFLRLVVRFVGHTLRRSASRPRGSARARRRGRAWLAT